MIWNKISRYAIIVIMVLVAAVYLPRLYWQVMGKRVHKPRVDYSPTIDEFLIRRSGTDKKARYTDLQGNAYSRKEYEILLPYRYYYNLEKWGVMPDSVDGLAVDISFIRQHSQMVRLHPWDLEVPQVDLYPLFESESEFTKLEFPDDLFRIKDRIEFIRTEDNTVNEEKSVRFTEALEQVGFDFPARLIAGNPTTRKPFDEGYFILDDAGDLYHLKRKKGDPFVVQVPVPPGIEIRTVRIFEYHRKEFYSILITESDEVYLILYDQYRFVQLPADGFDPDQMTFLFYTYPSYRSIQYAGDGTVRTVITDADFNVLAENEEHWITKDEKAAGKFEKYLFPFQISTSETNSQYIHFTIDYNGPGSLLMALFFLILGVIVKRVRRENLQENWFDYVILLAGGIYGFLALLFVKPEPWN